MHTLSALVLVVAATACSIARPPDPNQEDAADPDPLSMVYGKDNNPMESAFSRFVLHNGYIIKDSDENLRETELGDFASLDDLFRPYSAWDFDGPINKGIEPIPHETNSNYHNAEYNYKLSLDEPPHHSEIEYNPAEVMFENSDYLQADIPNKYPPRTPPQPDPSNQEIKRARSPSDPEKKRFALTPNDKEYYENDLNKDRQVKPTGIPAIEMHHEGGAAKSPVLVFELPRQIRQNPTLSKQKHLVEPDLSKLKVGLANKDYRMPVSLLPTNLRWLKINHPIDDDESSHEDGDVTIRPQHIHVVETASDPADSIYGVALIAAVGAALTMAILGFAFGWYTLSKKAKAAADVDYPAYGVTGPTKDTSGDRKLAHSAHMYHYQHQKQQIIAMERNGFEQRTGSVSDPESEDENEEGDYTVYECPGFATTGDMEVKNPLFNEDPTPATPGKCEVFKQQPKN